MKNNWLLKSVGIVFVLIFAQNLNAQDKAKINWITLDEAFAAIKKEPRKIVIDVYTDWCGWCKVMDKNTFANEKVANYINEKYYAVKLNAEQEGEIFIGEKKYNYPQLAQELMQGKMSYPTIVYLDEKFNMIQPVPGYQDANAFHQTITFLGDNYFKKEEFEKYKTGTYLKKYSK